MTAAPEVRRSSGRPAWMQCSTPFRLMATIRVCSSMGIFLVGSHAQHAGAVEQYVHPALGPRTKGFHGGLDAFRSGDIHDKRAGVIRTDYLQEVSQRVFVDIPKPHEPSLTCEVQRRGSADARGGAGDEDAFLCRHGHIFSRMWMHMAASSTPMLPPPFSASPRRAPSTCRLPAAPRSWRPSS